MTAAERRRQARRATDPPPPADPPGSSSRTAALGAALRAGAGYDPDEVADQLLRLDLLRTDALARVRVLGEAAADVAGELRRLADRLAPDGADVEVADVAHAAHAANLLRLADLLEAATSGPTATADGGE